MVAEREGARLVSEETVCELHRHGLHLVPFLGTPIAETTLEHSERHDADVWQQLRGLGWDGHRPVSGAGKCWIAGAPENLSRLMGWYKRPWPSGELWQPPANAHRGRAHHDDGTTTLLERGARRPVDASTSGASPEPKTPPTGAPAASLAAGRPVLRRGSRGADVAAWQRVVGATADGIFGEGTERLTRIWQAARGLLVDGVVGPRSWAKALGERASVDPHRSPDWPPRPEGLRPLSPVERDKLLGGFRFEPAPTPANPEAIRFLDDWPRRSIVQVELPQLRGAQGAPVNLRVPFHRSAAEQLRALFAAWEREGLSPLLLSWAGSWAPRFVRGSTSTLSNHAYGSAFDINVTWNPLGRRPALVGERGSVRELAPLAVEHGFWWGGWWEKRPDGHHLEVARLL